MVPITFIHAQLKSCKGFLFALICPSHATIKQNYARNRSKHQDYVPETFRTGRPEAELARRECGLGGSTLHGVDDWRKSQNGMAVIDD